jgi:RNA polymerase sigma-70 factor (ECF subfamily)
MNREHDSVTELVARARDGEVEAFEVLYRSHQAGVYTFILSQVREAELAADLTQQAFVRAWESLRRLREPGAFKGWLYRIASNLILDEVKSGRSRLEVAASALGEEDPTATTPAALDDGGNPEAMLESAELRQAVWAALNELSPEHRAAVVMHHVEGMGVSEIAKAVGVRPGTIMSRLARAREALRKSLSQYVEATDEGM